MGKHCLVCRRDKATDRMIDGVSVRLCDDCERDRFRRAEGKRRALVHGVRL